MYGEPGLFDFVLWSLVPGMVQALVIFAAIYFGISLGLKKLSLPSQGKSETQSASEIIRERYARGEISRREYEQMRNDLGPEQTSTGVDADYQKIR